MMIRTVDDLCAFFFASTDTDLWLTKINAAVGDNAYMDVLLRDLDTQKWYFENDLPSSSLSLVAVRISIEAEGPLSSECDVYDETLKVPFSRFDIEAALERLWKYANNEHEK